MNPKKKILVALVILAAVSAVYIAISYSFVTIDLSKMSDNPATLQINKTGSIHKTTEEVRPTKIRKLLKRGDYEISILQNESSYYKIARAKGFLKSTTLNPTLLKDGARSFVGNGPSNCIYYQYGLLISNDCGVAANEAKLHLPSSSQQPSSTKRLIGAPADSFMLNMVAVGGMPIVIVFTPESGYFAYTLGTDGRINNPVKLGNLDAGVDYSFRKSAKGFIAFSEEGNELLEYADINLPPAKISINRPGSAEQKLVGLSTAKNTILAIYSSYLSVDDNDLIDAGGIEAHSEEQEEVEEKAGSELVVLTGNDQQTYSLSASPVGIRLCSDNIVCILQDGELTLLDVSKNQPREIVKLAGITDVRNNGDNILIVNDVGVIDFSPINYEGHYIYRLGEYSYCGAKSVSAQETLVCIENGQGDSSILIVNQAEPNIDDIDKKLLALTELDEVKTVSAYRNIIHIVPEAGEVVFNEEIGSFDYDPVERKKVNSIIDQKITEIGIDRSKYTIINALDY